MKNQFRNAAQKVRLFQQYGMTINYSTVPVEKCDAFVAFLQGHNQHFEVLNAQDDGTVTYATKLQTFTTQYRDMMKEWQDQSGTFAQTIGGGSQRSAFALLINKALMPFSATRREVKAAVDRMGLK